MSTELVNGEIRKFLSRTGAEVLCIRGKWGVGKTYAWTKGLEEAQSAGKIALSRYSYVSLFGIDSLDQLKLAIFENVITLGEGTLRANLDTLDRFVSSNIGKWRKITRFAHSIPIVKSIIDDDSAALLSFLTISDQIVCVDDLERKGKNLEVGDVLGLISFLREHRGCKVALILNDERLEGDAKKEFEAHLEKVVDVSLIYEPTSSEAVAIALKGTDSLSQRAATLCASLGIRNIRIIKKIERAFADIQALLADFDKEVFELVTNSLALFVWSYHQKDGAPPLEFLTIKKAKASYDFQTDENISDEEASWNALLESYGYRWTDEFDLVLIDGVKRGFFDSAEITRHARELQSAILAGRADGSFSHAWRTYHDSFDDNEEEVLHTIHDSFSKNYKYISPLNLNGTVRLFKELGRNKEAIDILNYYIENRNEAREFFDLDRYPFSSEITEHEVVDAFRLRCSALQETWDFRSTLLRLKDSWNEDTIGRLAAVPVDEYRRVFKGAKADELRKMINAALQFDRIRNASEKEKEVSKRAKEALKLIGSESRINARRVSRFGIKVQVQG